MTVLAKVCGLVRAEDAAFAAATGADLLGFVSHPPSPRHCADLAVAAPYLDRAVLVQVAGSAEEVISVARRHGFRKVQPYLPALRRQADIRALRESGLQVLLPWADEAGQIPVQLPPAWWADPVGPTPWPFPHPVISCWPEASMPRICKNESVPSQHHCVQASAGRMPPAGWSKRPA